MPPFEKGSQKPPENYFDANGQRRLYPDEMRQYELGAHLTNSLGVELDERLGDMPKFLDEERAFVGGVIDRVRGGEPVSPDEMNQAKKCYKSKPGCRRFISIQIASMLASDWPDTAQRLIEVFGVSKDYSDYLKKMNPPRG